MLFVYDAVGNSKSLNINCVLTLNYNQALPAGYINFITSALAAML